MTGFFLITRGISKHHLFKCKPDRLAVWMWLLDNVAFKDTTQDAKGKTIAVPRGSVCASLRHIAYETGVGLQVVRTALKRFETEQMVNTKVTHGKTVISLCNYEKHQRSETEANATLTQDQHKPNTQKKQGNKVTTEDTNVSSRDLGFSDFWNLWPSKVGKQDAIKAWRRLKLDDKRLAFMAVRDGWFERWRQSQPDANPIHASRFLNGKRWNDQLTQPQLKAIHGGRNERTDRNDPQSDPALRAIAAAATSF